MARKLPIPDGTRARVWLKLVQILQADPVLKRVFGDRWHVMDGDADDVTGLAELEAPSIRLMPQLGPSSWWSPDAHQAPITVLFEVLVDGLDACDRLNLTEAIERALYPADHDAALAQERALVALGARDGQPEFTQALNDTGQAWASDQQHLRGAISLNVVRSIVS